MKKITSIILSFILILCAGTLVFAGPGDGVDPPPVYGNPPPVVDPAGLSLGVDCFATLAMTGGSVSSQ